MVNIELPVVDTFGRVAVSGYEPDVDWRAGAVLRAAIAQYGVLCIRFSRALTEVEFERVATVFGGIKEPVGRTKDGGLYRYTERRQRIDAGRVIDDEATPSGQSWSGGTDPRRPGLFETFHCDDTFTETPAQITVLHARALPPSGGGPTHFIDMRGAYKRLGGSTKALADRAMVQYAYNNAGAFPPRVSARGPAEALVDVSHPLVRVHPQAGTRALYLDLDRAKGVEGMPLREGRQFLRRLQDAAEQSAPRFVHQWQAHDVLAWDNASVQHKAGGDFPMGEPREFWRYLVGGLEA